MTALVTTNAELVGRTALVTGATSGIGKAAALALATRGATVYVHGRNAERATALVEQIDLTGGHGRVALADLADPAAVARLAVQVGPIDILVNNAGIAWFGPSADLDAPGFDPAEFAPAGIRVNAVAPGPVFTEGSVDERTTALGASTLLNRAAQPEEIAEAITFLASSRSSYITGAVLPVDGGRTAI